MKLIKEEIEYYVFCFIIIDIFIFYQKLFLTCAMKSENLIKDDSDVYMSNSSDSKEDSDKLFDFCIFHVSSSARGDRYIGILAYF